jgi:hypothetical protein
MSSINDIVDNINKIVSTTNKKYVYFEKENGIIRKILNSKETSEDLETIEIESKEINDILIGKRSSIDFKIEFDILDNRYKLIDKKEIQINQKVYLYEIKNINPYDLKIEQDKVNNVWRFSFSDNRKNSLKDSTIKKNNFLKFYICEYGNPDILYRTINVNVNNLLKNKDIEILFDSSLERHHVTMLTDNYFNSCFEVINE